MDTSIVKPNNIDAIDELLKKFTDYIDVRKSSKNTYANGIKRFSYWLREYDVKNITRDTILRYKEYIENQNYSAYTRAIYITSIRLFFKWTESEGIYPNVVGDIKGAKKPNGYCKDPFTIEQVKELLSNIDRSTLQGKRDYAMLNLLVGTGIREIELIKADMGDIRQESGEVVLFIQGKGHDSKDDFVVLTNSVIKPINEYQSARIVFKETDPLFSSLSDRNYNKRLTTRSISRIVRNYLNVMGLHNKRLTAHSFRHTAITHCIQQGANIQDVQKMARHTNINTTMIYFHNINRIRNAPEKYLNGLYN